MSEQTFKKLSNGVTYLRPEEILDQPVVGKYLESYVDNTGKFTATKHKIETENGIVILNGAGSLNKKLERVELGQTVKIEYMGKNVMSSGKFKGTEAHVYEVSVAE